MNDLERYRATDLEKARAADLLRIIPRGHSVLDIGARDGHFSRPLTEYFTEVTALDLRKPAFEFPRVVTVAGDVTRLDFPDDSFDCVFCTEVLEHIPAVEKACKEISRVARREIVIGVPFRQDIRFGRVTCRACGRIGPPWGHVNSFDEAALRRLFPGLRVASKSFVGSNEERTTALAALLMDLGGNRWGMYDPGETCVHCGALLVAPADLGLWRKVCCGVAARMNRAQAIFVRPQPNWIHLVLSKR